MKAIVSLFIVVNVFWLVELCSAYVGYIKINKRDHA